MKGSDEENVEHYKLKEKESKGNRERSKGTRGKECEK